MIVLPQPQLARRDRSMQAYCDRQWQVHERHGRVGLPFHEDRYPFLAAKGRPEYLEALLMICAWVAPAATDALMDRLLVLRGERVPAVQQRWQDLYRDDLYEFPKLEMHLANDEFYQACQLVFKRAELTVIEQDVCRLWMAGYAIRLSDGTWEGSRHIARLVHRRKAFVELQLEQARERLASFAAVVAAAS